MGHDLARDPGTPAHVLGADATAPTTTERLCGMGGTTAARGPWAIAMKWPRHLLWLAVGFAIGLISRLFW